MKVTVVAVCSINGKLTNGDDPNIYKWTSKEDQNFFFSLISKSKLIVMGSGTYRAIRAKLKVQSEKLRVVLTSLPGKYSSEQVPRMLEFSSETPEELVSRLEKKYNELLLVGGAKVYSSFMKAGLVDEIYLTIEPIVFENGKNLFADGDFDVDLKLVSSKKLNKNGTILLKYIVKK